MAKAAAVERGRIYVARESFTHMYEGAPRDIVAGVTRVREGHPILDGIEHLFKPIDAHYDIEQASAAPGEVRGG